MQHLQQYYCKFCNRSLVAAMVILAANAALTAPPQTACQAGADYVAGVDVDGKPVTPADIDAQKVALPDKIVVPLPNQRRGGHVVLQGRALAPQADRAPCGN